MGDSLVRELYASPNGDTWALARSGRGELVVRHHANRASGGIVSDIAVDVFLSHGGQGPEYQALSAALAELDLSGENSDVDKADAEKTDQIDRARGETLRQALAVHLHDKHERTVQSVQANAMPEPDSLGG